MNTKIESLPRPRLRALHAAGTVVADRNGFSPKPTPFEAKPVAALQAGTIVSRHVGRFEADAALRELPARVRKGQRVATINALGNAHAVLAPFDGIVTEMLTSCGQPCEYGQPVLRMAPA
jgi:biotin carboxyl carrier protein